MASFLLNTGIAALSADGTTSVDWDDNSTTTIKLKLCTGTINPTKTSGPNLSDLTYTEFSDASYTAGGNAVSSRSIDIDTTNNEVEYRAADVTFSSIDGSSTITHAILYKSTGNSTTDIPLAIYDIADTTPNGNDLTIKWGVENGNSVCFKVTN